MVARGIWEGRGTSSGGGGCKGLPEDRTGRRATLLAYSRISQKPQGSMKKLPLTLEVVFLFPLLGMVSCAAPRQVGPDPNPAGAAVTSEAGTPPPRVRIVQPGAPGQASRVLTPAELSTREALPYTQADIEFMQGMIPHHAQALDMAALVEERTQSEDLRLLAQRIEISQRDEIALMGSWLRERGQEVPGDHAHHMMGDHLMPGMLTAEQMAQLAAARGGEFDRLFLELMIMHHEGALYMVDELFSHPGAGQETDMFTFASHVDADQQIEIRRMRQMLAAGR